MKSARILCLGLGVALLSAWTIGCGSAIAAITNKDTISIDSSSHTENVSSTDSDIILSWDAAVSDVGGDITYEYILNQTAPASVTHSSFTTDLGSVNTSTLITGSLTNAITKNFSNVVDGSFYFHLRAYDSQGIVDGTSVISYGPIVLDSAPTLAGTPISPATGDHTLAIAVTITGAKFISGATVELVNGTRGATDLSDVTLTNVTVVDSNTITATVPVNTVPGTYDLRVTNGAPHEQQVSSVDAYTSTNQIPVADAGEDQILTLSGGSVTLNLDGISSSDPDGDDISTYSWTTVTDPSGDLAELFSGSTKTFVLNTAGTYEFSLIVNDGFHNSTADTVEVTVSSTSNNPPTANAGADQNVVLGTQVTLNGSQSDDPDDDGLTYSWTFSNAPSASSLESSDINQTNTTDTTATFTPDAVGDYTISLIVNDSTVDSTADTMVVTVHCIDTDDDGLCDTVEDLNSNDVVDEDETDPADPDTDGDGVQDGTESGKTLDDIGIDTDTDIFVPDLDSATTTDPLLADTDDDGLLDGVEDANQDGAVDDGESDPDDATDPCSLTDYFVVNPQFTALVSSDTDRVVFFNSSQSSCYEMVSCVKEDQTCTDEWSFGGTGSIVGGNGDDIIVYQYSAAGDYSVSLIMTESISSTEAAGGATATAEIVEIPLPSADFSTAVNVATVTLNFDVLPGDVTEVHVYWGDRNRSVESGTIPASIDYTYTRTGSDYHIRVKTIDGDANEFNYTVNVDADLTVTIP
ncbi:hypothetical protein KAR91_06025 [Candidatus Pacearchaeota archaeon]|nr:hypothetical protein [Candidatus Pacearchaeota archaeon]